MIKRVLSLTIFLLLTSASYSQNNTFSQIKNKIHEKYPELSLEDRIIALSYWTVSDEKSRNNNVAFEKAIKVYHDARLKGGSEGLVVLTVSGDNLNPEATIVLSKDNIIRSLSFSSAELGTIIPGTWSNLVYDSNGKEIYRDLDNTQIYSSIQKLITR
jgi:hypothetical protein